MASVPLTPAQPPELQALLDSLAPNVMPAQPSLWPLASGYWLVLLAVMIGIVTVAILWYRDRHWRCIHQQLKHLRQQSQPLKSLHELLRWVLISQLKTQRHLDDQAFAQKVTDTLGEQPQWVNAHYQQNSENIGIDWQQIQKLLTLWKKEARQ